MRFEVTILGCGSAVPTLLRSASAQYVNVLERHLLLDCGEGTQVQLRKFKTKFQKIDHVFISHLHGDHFLGLIGLLSSFHLLGRTRPLHIYAPSSLREIIDVTMKASQTHLNYRWILYDLNFNNKEVIFEDKLIQIESFPLKHRIDCCGFLIKEKKRELNVLKDKIKEFSIPLAQIPGIKKGKDLILKDGTIIKNQLITKEPLPERSYAYCSDTTYSNKVIDAVREVDVLYHEATFTEEKRARAKETFHSTALQAATVAANSKVGKLIVGHYSARYKELDDFDKEISPVFNNYQLAYDGMIITL
ncbi:MAG: ribonuclease Z [Crocinitomicaceae bacterium]|jgi:ribonuclease Z|nr:ribonuclease Z [Crocinitomicaceae bacterium]